MTVRRISSARLQSQPLHYSTLYLFGREIVGTNDDISVAASVIYPQLLHFPNPPWPRSVVAAPADAIQPRLEQDEPIGLKVSPKFGNHGVFLRYRPGIHTSGAQSV